MDDMPPMDTNPMMGGQDPMMGGQPPMGPDPMMGGQDPMMGDQQSMGDDMGGEQSPKKEIQQTTGNLEQLLRNYQNTVPSEEASETCGASVSQLLGSVMDVLNMKQRNKLINKLKNYGQDDDSMPTDDTEGDDENQDQMNGGNFGNGNNGMM